MTLAEQFKCEIPTPDALKEGVLYCSTNATNWTDVWATVASVVTAPATVGLVIGAYFAWKTAKKTLNQMEEDSKAQSRPYVHAWIVPSIGGGQAWDLLVKNTGKSTAKNLKLSVDEWPEDDALTEALRTFFEAGQSLPPNSTIRTYWYLGEREQEGSTGSTGFDVATRIYLNYEGLEPSDKFSESFVLDTRSVGMTPVGASGVDLVRPYSKTEKKLSEIVTALNNMRREISDS